MSESLIDIVQQMGHPKILVIGDLILDRYIWGDAERVSQEAPVILLREEKQEIRLGGAANVAHLLQGLEAEVTIAGVVGNDIDGQNLLQQFQKIGIDHSQVLLDHSRPTTVKERYLGRAQYRHPHQMLRVDREVRTPLSPELTQQLLETIFASIDQYQAILFSDYAKGVCTPELISQVICQAKAKQIPLIADPPANQSWQHYQGTTAITPNRLETKLATQRSISSVEQAFTAGQQLCEELDLDHIFVTLDSDGIALVTQQKKHKFLPTRRREVYDITGAGDMVLAMIGIGTASGIDPEYLARLANIAGGLEVEQVGVAQITRQQVIADLITHSKTINSKLCTLDQLTRHVETRRKLGQSIVLTNGCFDLLHVGHVSYLEQAAQQGDCLIVAMNSDQSVKQLNKGSDRPIFDQTQRAKMLSALEFVDYVLIFDELTPHLTIERLRPDLLVKGGTYSADQIVGKELVEQYGGMVKPLGEIPGISTTTILQKIRQTNQVVSFSSAPNENNISERRAG